MRKLLIVCISLYILLASVLFASCSDSDNEQSASDVSSDSSLSDISNGNSSDVSADESGEVVEFSDTLTSTIFDGISNEMYCLTTEFTSGGTTGKRVIATDGKAIYSSVTVDGVTAIYLSNGDVTYQIDPSQKIYYIWMLSPLVCNFEYEYGMGSSYDYFNNELLYFETFYDEYTDTIYCHFFNADKKWKGFEIYDGETLIESNVVISLTDEIPSDVFFTIPEGYTQYVEDNDFSITSEWAGMD